MPNMTRPLAAGATPQQQHQMLPSAARKHHLGEGDFSDDEHVSSCFSRAVLVAVLGLMLAAVAIGALVAMRHGWLMPGQSGSRAPQGGPAAQTAPPSQEVTQALTLDGDFQTVVTDKAMFLQECSGRLAPARCVDVKPGSILLTVAGASMQVLKAAESIVTSFGLSLPSFGTLRLTSLKMPFEIPMPNHDQWPAELPKIERERTTSREQQEPLIFGTTPPMFTPTLPPTPPPTTTRLWESPTLETTLEPALPLTLEPTLPPTLPPTLLPTTLPRTLPPDTTGEPAASSREAPFIGVNLGGWLVLESWMWAAEMENKGIKDEWSLVKSLGGPGDMRAISLIQNHRDTFLTESDLDSLVNFGVTRVRIPVGWWLVDYDLADGFVDGAKHFLTRALGWLKNRNIRALLDLHALPGAQASKQGYTGKMEQSPGFFLDESQYRRGKGAIRKLAGLILEYESDSATSGVIFGMELVNEPDEQMWDHTPGQRTLYEEIIPELRTMLPADRYALYINPQEGTPHTSALWLQNRIRDDPQNYANVVYDIHVYHGYGDDQAPWTPEQDSCKTCCRDPARMAPLVQAQVPIAIGEYSLTTGFAGDNAFWASFMQNQLSLWYNTKGIEGSFFWNFRILPNPQKAGWYVEFSLLNLYGSALQSALDMEYYTLCPAEDLERCPAFSAQTVGPNSRCLWT
eukprot:TRINITY_DN24645_c0_g1_i1.p1 TRINITY_DN24645_c0_g1~~TRINITY_DN24645_c0_g1_i1.p1  ORF type:complete len:771 (+),score=113.58 TRINITY_DN24645_c0_g1_i1:261-2315(+)